MVPHYSTLSSLACKSCQLGKHAHVSLSKYLNNWIKSPLELVHTDDGVLVGLRQFRISIMSLLLMIILDVFVIFNKKIELNYSLFSKKAMDLFCCLCG